jgi:hypothetical protein
MNVQQALREKEKAIRQHAASVKSSRLEIASIVCDQPEAAFAAAQRTLHNKRGSAVAWSKREWQQILRTWTPDRIAELLVHPSPAQEALADSHPFGGVLALRHGG